MLRCARADLFDHGSFIHIASFNRSSSEYFLTAAGYTLGWQRSVGSTQAPQSLNPRRTRMTFAAISRKSATALATGLVLSTAASASDHAIDKDYGNPSTPDYADRVVTIKPDARWVNVTQDETVRFVDARSGATFTWKFDTVVRVFDLTSVAPSGILGAHHVDA
jgi:hypothetical protein